MRFKVSRSRPGKRTRMSRKVSRMHFRSRSGSHVRNRPRLVKRGGYRI